MSALTPKQLADALERMSYWPGWEFSILETPIGPMLRIVVEKMPDANHIGETIDLGINSHIHPMFSVEEFRDWLGWRLTVIVLHEHQEAFRWDGKKVYDPHAEHDHPVVPAGGER